MYEVIYKEIKLIEKTVSTQKIHISKIIYISELRGCELNKTNNFIIKTRPKAVL